MQMEVRSMMDDFFSSSIPDKGKAFRTIRLFDAGGGEINPAAVETINDVATCCILTSVRRATSNAPASAWPLMGKIRRRIIQVDYLFAGTRA